MTSGEVGMPDQKQASSKKWDSGGLNVSRHSCTTSSAREGDNRAPMRGNVPQG